MTSLSKDSRLYSSFFGVWVSFLILLFVIRVWLYFIIAVEFPQKNFVIAVGGVFSLFCVYQISLLFRAIMKRRRALSAGVEGRAKIVKVKPRYATLATCQLELEYDSKILMIEDRYISTLYKNLTVNREVKIRFLPESPDTFIILDL